MQNCIIKLNKTGKDYYLEWSTITNAPTTAGMPLDEFKRWYQQKHGTEGMRNFDERLRLVQETGTSMQGETLESLLRMNRSSHTGTYLNRTQIIRKYCTLSLTKRTSNPLDKLIIPGEKGRIELYSHVGAFNDGLDALEKEGFDFIPARDLAEARLLCDAQRDVNLASQHAAEKLNYGTWVGENLNYFPNGDLLFADLKHNPLVRAAQEATHRHRNNYEFYLETKVAKDLRERAETDPEKALKSGVLLVRRKTLKNDIPSTELQDHPLMQFLFQDKAQQYGQSFLWTNGIKSLPVDVFDAAYAKKHPHPFARELWIDTLFANSRLGLDGHPLSDYFGRVSGIRRVA